MGGGAYVGQGNFDIGGVGLGGGNGRGGVKGFVDGSVYKFWGYWLSVVKTYLRCCISGWGSVAILRARLVRVEMTPILVLGG